MQIETGLLTQNQIFPSLSGTNTPKEAVTHAMRVDNHDPQLRYGGLPVKTVLPSSGPKPRL